MLCRLLAVRDTARNVTQDRRIVSSRVLSFGVSAIDSNTTSELQKRSAVMQLHDVQAWPSRSGGPIQCLPVVGSVDYPVVQ